MKTHMLAPRLGALALAGATLWAASVTAGSSSPAGAIALGSCK